MKLIYINFTDLCSNGIKDVAEEDVDCGGSCRPCTTCKPGNHTILIMSWQYILFVLNYQLHCYTTNVSIAENGAWGVWGRWAGCTNPVKCVDFDRQRKKRTRACNNPCGGDKCPGPSSQTLKCTPRCCEYFEISLKPFYNNSLKLLLPMQLIRSNFFCLLI